MIYSLSYVIIQQDFPVDVIIQLQYMTTEKSNVVSVKSAEDTDIIEYYVLSSISKN